MKQTTTHLICAPTLHGYARVEALLASPGDLVEADTPLISLVLDGEQLVVHASTQGVIESFVVMPEDEIGSDELLLMMEVEEPDDKWLDWMEGLPPACAAMPLPAAVADASEPLLQVTRSAAALAARLGVDLAQVHAGPSGVIDEAAVEAWVRQALGARR
ncbi:hypothetical protein GCM10007860_01230 [Chitiniphilus shinanonensis]|uniref:Lipoyl-binding domain-containing protein n=1 Tax=Chitiniphilus shinanonensis TaxID=553088 RepID=A0ABQ6BLU4_9NEIS|nr:hypothetical protein [Chitiniphilus shinanonensis]GLS02980.1 hypothetical protein GCM10007860_01230 [Chitiniphilus shinanonensis]